ncbi:prostate-specific antigen-like [Meriones unguiculatus]|uniref:prostate-specific antigen-like n=1 Tax=Meriones unguiculatus TaxID=10047 RepID=UPI000B4F3BB2|nr:prostate-specific antigen-like [Meriones unguiculatus]
MWFLVLCLVLSLGKYGALPLTVSRAVGGWECERQSQPWQAVVHDHDRAVCGGTLVHPHWLLTAAHCISSDSKVCLGQHSLDADDDTGQGIAASRSIPHPLYDMSLLEPRFLSPNADNSHDLMLLQLCKPAIITEAMRVLSLPTEEPEPGSCCLASGWGIIKPDKSVRARELQCVDLNLMPNDVCQMAYLQNVTESMLCAGHQGGGKNTCMGDSGGRLVCDGVLQGITSWGGDPCAWPSRPSLFTKVTLYTNWIKVTMKDNLEVPVASLVN